MVPIPISGTDQLYNDQQDRDPSHLEDTIPAPSLLVLNKTHHKVQKLKHRQLLCKYV